MVAGNPGKHRKKVIFLMSAGAVGIILLILGMYQLVAFSDTTAFCGRLCHTVMYPEYTAYQASPHSRVLCVDCHVGSGADYLVRSKISGIPLIFSTLTNSYHRPIEVPVKNLRPARDTCEQCHRPEKFTGDLVRTTTTYATDEANTPTTSTRILRIGGGENLVASGIHWHISASVYYLPLDKERNQIGWVGVVNSSGNMTEYTDPVRAGEITRERIDREKRLMDCVDCHNRATHIFNSPSDLLDSALVEGRIDPGLPFLKREALKVLDPPNASLSEAYSRVETIRDFYRNSYPDIAASRSQAIEQAIARIKEIARLTTFPDMKVTWNTYPTELGHSESPGCFRCHGTLISESTGTKIESGCETCHFFSIP
jgi:hypothetical protein